MKWKLIGFVESAEAALLYFAQRNSRHYSVHANVPVAYIVFSISLVVLGLGVLKQDLLRFYPFKPFCLGDSLILIYNIDIQTILLYAVFSKSYPSNAKILIKMG